MIPLAKKNLHECKYHLENLLKSKNFEEAEINLAAFVNSGRNTTFVLQKQYSKNSQFTKWYGNSKKENILCEHCGKKISPPYDPEKGTKQYEMKNDELCQFFHELRNKIVKEGINKLDCSTNIESINTELDFLDQPTNSSLNIEPNGIWYHIHKGTAKEDLIPAQSATAKIITSITISNPPTQHLGRKIENNQNPVILAQLYYNYLKNLVEEWTEIINNVN